MMHRLRNSNAPTPDGGVSDGTNSDGFVSVAVRAGDDFISVAVDDNSSNDGGDDRSERHDQNHTPLRASSTGGGDDDGDNDDYGGGDEEEAAGRRRSLMMDLWDEAGSSSRGAVLPLAADVVDIVGRGMHHRRGGGGAASPSPAQHHRSSPFKRAGSSGSKGAKSRSGVRVRGHHRVRRAERVAKRVWLAAFAAFAVSLLIAVHVYLYRALVAHQEGSASSVRNFGATSTASGILGDAPDATMTMEEAKAAARTLSDTSSLTPLDRSQYTIRMNTWRRNEQLLLSLDHHASCDGVALIQVVWCDAENEPPDEVVNHSSGKVVVERHAINSLNERFRIAAPSSVDSGVDVPPPTRGVLSLDDDVLRPCDALDAGFLRWTRHPERMVGFDIRSHVVVEEENEEEGGEKEEGDGGDETGSSTITERRADSRSHPEWKYAYLSTTEKSNRYSMTLPRSSFLHRDYLRLYTSSLPRSMYTYIDQSFECEDVAMSFFVSALTDGKPPLIADRWAVKSMVKLFSPSSISSKKGHKAKRDRCVNDFAEELGLKEGEGRLRTAVALHLKNPYFGYGAEPEDWTEDVDVEDQDLAFRMRSLVYRVRGMTEMDDQNIREVLRDMKRAITGPPKKAGLIENTESWKRRWQQSGEYEDGGGK